MELDLNIPNSLLFKKQNILLEEQDIINNYFWQCLVKQVEDTGTKKACSAEA
jgi:hypothetical protein